MFFIDCQLLLPNAATLTLSVTDTAFCKVLVTFGNPLVYSEAGIAAEPHRLLRNMSTPVATLLVSVILSFAVGVQGMVCKSSVFKIAFFGQCKNCNINFFSLQD